MRTRKLMLVLAGLAILTASGGLASRPQDRLDRLRQEVWRTEEAFAATMARRDFAAFQSFLSPETVFWTGGVKRGRADVAAAWKRHYDAPQAPFSWKPEAVEVLESGTLALSSGPVFNPAGARVGTFNSVWRREPDGRWLIVFDKGCPPCGATP